MFRKDIENLYTDTVREYLDNGYRIYYSTMGGSQGEIAKIDLTNDKEIIRILLESKNECYMDNPIDLNYFAIIVGRNTDKLIGDTFFDTIWNGHLELISELRIYKIGRKDNSFFGTKQEAIDAMLKYYERLKFRSFDWVEERVELNSDEAKKIVLPFVKRQYKCKSATVKDIEKIEKIIHKNGKVYYMVQVKGKRYKMNNKIKLNNDSF